MPSPVWPLPICLDSWTQHSSIALTASDFTSITSHIHNWVMLLLWLYLFILSEVVSSLFSSSILGTYQPEEFIFQCPIFLPFHTVQGLSRQEYWSGLPFPSPVDHILSEVSTMTHPSWVALHGMAHSFIELDKAVYLRLSIFLLKSCYELVLHPALHFVWCTLDTPRKPLLYFKYVQVC